MFPKLAFRIRPYSLEPSPLSTDDMPRYTLQELKKIEDVLQPLIAAYAPSVFADLKYPAQPLALTTDWRPITNYNYVIKSEQIDAINIEIDKAAGTITPRGEGDTSPAVFMWAALSVGLSNYPQNNEIEIILRDTVSGQFWPVGVIYKSDQQQEYGVVSIAKSLLINNNTSIRLEIRSTAAAAVTYLSGSLGFRYLNYAQVE
jgi:hypothetical protein